MRAQVAELMDPAGLLALGVIVEEALRAQLGAARCAGPGAGLGAGAPRAAAPAAQRPSVDRDAGTPRPDAS